MGFRRLGRSGLAVSVVGLGTNNLGMKLDAEQSRAVVHAALDAGITLFDTADSYGESEERLGELLAGPPRRRRASPRSSAATYGRRGSDNGADWGARGSRRYIRRAVEASLRRLRTDWIDLYQLHRPDPATPIEETLSALDDLVHEGKVRYLGSSNFTGWQVADAEWTARTRGLERFVSAQNEYSLLDARGRGRPGAGAGAVRHRPAAVLPAGQRPAHRQVPPRRGSRRRAAGSPHGAWSRCSPTRPSTPSRRSRRSPRARGVTCSTSRSAAWPRSRRSASVIAGATTPEQVRPTSRPATGSPTLDDLAELDGLDRLISSAAGR